LVKAGAHIRRAVTGDAQLLSEMSAITFFDTFNGTCTDKDIQGFIEANFNREQIFEELQNADDFYFIAFVNDKAVGVHKA
jgi:hypothetical protein